MNFCISDLLSINNLSQSFAIIIAKPEDYVEFYCIDLIYTCVDFFMYLKIWNTKPQHIPVMNDFWFDLAAHYLKTSVFCLTLNNS